MLVRHLALINVFLKLILLSNVAVSLPPPESGPVREILARKKPFSHSRYYDC